MLVCIWTANDPYCWKLVVLVIFKFDEKFCPSSAQALIRLRKLFSVICCHKLPFAMNVVGSDKILEFDVLTCCWRKNIAWTAEKNDFKCQIERYFPSQACSSYGLRTEIVSLNSSALWKLWSACEFAHADQSFVVVVLLLSLVSLRFMADQGSIVTRIVARSSRLS